MFNYPNDTWALH